MYQEEKPDSRTGFRNFVGAVVFVARTLAVSIEVFLHKAGSFGERYLGLQAGLALLLIFFWPAFCGQQHDPQPMFMFLAFFIARCATVRVSLAVRRWRGMPQPHTRYSGEPWLIRFTGRMDEVKVKCMVEPFVAFTIGALLLGLSPPLGGFVMIAALGLMISNRLAEGCVRERTRDMHDTYIDQRRVVEQFRDLRRD